MHSPYIVHVYLQDFEALVDKHIKMKELQTQMKELVEVSIHIELLICVFS